MEFLADSFKMILSCTSAVARGEIRLCFWRPVPSFLKNYGVIRSFAFGLYLLFRFDVLIISYKNQNVNNNFEIFKLNVLITDIIFIRI